MGIESIIPPEIGRPTENLPTDKWRWLMAADFDEESYGQRWQSETVMFMLKQHQGEALGARTYRTRRREMALRCITHNVMIVYVWGGFLQGTPDPLSGPGDGGGSAQADPVTHTIRPMHTPHRMILGLACLLLLGITLFPPAMATRLLAGDNIHYPAGRLPLVWPPKPDEGERLRSRSDRERNRNYLHGGYAVSVYRVDLVRYGMEVASIGLASAALWVLTYRGDSSS